MPVLYCLLNISSTIQIFLYHNGLKYQYLQETEHLGDITQNISFRKEGEFSHM